MPHAVDQIFWLIRSAIIPVGLAMLAAAVLTTSSQAQEWPTTDWQPVCYEQRESECDLQDEGVAVSLEQLGEASRYFSVLGFRPPAISRRYANLGILDTYPAYFEREPQTRADSEVWGTYDPEAKLLRVSYEGYFAFETETAGMMYTPTHELFHAIQFAYPALAALWDTGKEGEWIIEGTAVAAEAVRAGDVDAIPRTGALDSPLYDMRTLSGVESRYLSYPFWLYLADRYGGGLPDGIAILHDIFSDAENYGTRRRAIDIIDGALRRYDPEGLYGIYPAFIAEYGAKPEQYSEMTVHGVLPPEDVHPAFYNVQIDGTVAPLAAKPYHIRAIGAPAGEDHEASEVEIRLEAENPEALHLVVDDTRFDAIKRSSGGERNVYTAKFRGDLATDVFPVDEYFVRVVNVARDPAAYKDQNFKLIVTVYHEYIEMTGPHSDSSNDAGPDNAAIDTPIKVSAKAVSQFWGPMRLRLIREAGLNKPCIFQLGAMANDRLMSVNLSLLQDGPLRVGEYPIYRLEPIGPNGHYANPPREHLKVSGQAVAEFGLAPKHPLVGEYGMEYAGQGGTLTIESITPHWINGIVRIAGAWRGIRPNYLPHDAPPAGPINLEIEMAFSVPNASIAKRVNTASCIRP